MKWCFFLIASFLISNSCVATPLKEMIGPKAFKEGKQLTNSLWTNDVSFVTDDRGLNIHIARYATVIVLTYLEGKKAGHQLIFDSNKMILLFESPQAKVEKKAVIHAYENMRICTNCYGQFFIKNSSAEKLAFTP